MKDEESPFQEEQSWSVGRRIALRPINTEDYASLRALELSESLGPKWRFRGATPGPEQYVQALWNGVLAQFLVITRGGGEGLGIVTAYNADLTNGHASVAAAKFDRGDNSTNVLQGTLLFIDYIFRVWPLRKIYAETLEFNLGQFRSGLNRLFVEEGRLRDHAYSDGIYWDQVYLALYRETWFAQRGALMRLIKGPVGPGSRK